MNLLIDKYPNIAKLYDAEKNDKALETITCGLSYMAHWKCPKCGQDFVRRVSHMIEWRSVKCPQCLQTICYNPSKTNVVGITKVSDFPLLNKEWDPQNKSTPENTSAGSNKKVYWICSECGHRWITSPNKRTGTDKTGCPECAKKRRGISLSKLTALENGSVEDVIPELLLKWDYDKNSIKPSEISVGSNRDIWFKCDKGHSYKTKVSKASICPICANKKILPGFNDFASVHPELLEWWDFEKNKIKPDTIAPNSNKMFWWKCKYGHSFSRSASYIVRGRGCPICAGKQVLFGYNDLASQNPKLAAEWNPVRNGSITPEMVTQKSNKTFWWKCHICGYEWRASVNTRNKNGCPNCSKKGESIPEFIILFYLRKAGIECVHKYKPWGAKGKEIDVYIPNRMIGIEYDGVKYHDLKRDYDKSKLCKDNKITLIRFREEGLPDLQTCDIQIPVSIDIRKRNADYENLIEPLTALFEFLNVKIPDINLKRDLKGIISIYETSKGQKSLAYVNPKLAAEWDYSKNNGLTPEQVSSSSSLKVSWICSRGHTWKANIYSRATGCGCPYCSNQKVLKGFNDLLSQRPDIAEEWAEDNTQQPDEFVYTSNKKVKFKCKVCGTTWITPISCRTLQGTGCPKCGQKKSANERILTYIQKYGSLQSKFPNIALEWDFNKNEGTPENYTASSKKSVWWICPHGHNYKAAIGNRTRGGTGCPICYKGKRQSKV